jgi:dihydrofolate synthase/folylpolyglutamate synthase
MKYEEIVEYILCIPKFTKKNTMEDTRAFYEFLGCPGEQKKIIHVAGTNGKGSVCAFLNQIFVEGGYSVGMFTSPHLIYIEERFQVNGKQMSTDIFEKIFLLLQKNLKEYQKYKPEFHPTFFEFLFFMGMLFFKNENVDYIILETGLGGRLDATNIIRNPEICVITKIDLDHTEYLGDTLKEIAFEKAGIIKEGTPVLVWNENEEVADVIRNQASKKNADIYFTDFTDAIGVENRNKKIDFY